MKHILLAQRACVDFYPPVLNQATFLSNQMRVTLLDTREEDSVSPPELGTIERVQVPIRTGARYRRLRVLDSLRRYIREFNRQLRRRPALVIAYDTDAAFLLLRSHTESLKIVHLHELPERKHFKTRGFSLLARNYALRNLNRANLVVVPDADRAIRIQRQCKLRNPPIAAMNCPRRMDTLPKSRLLPYLREHELSSHKIVHYQGAGSPHHNLERVIESMRYWPSDSIFVIVGRSEHECPQLRRAAEAAGVTKRVIFLGRVPYEAVFSYAMGASVGVTFLDGSYRQWKYSAGASNKRFEYVALGIPQVTNPLPGVRELFESKGVARTAPYDNTEAIGRAISSYLEDESERRCVFERARALHLQRYNYETQFEPILHCIRNTSGRGQAAYARA